MRILTTRPFGGMAARVLLVVVIALIVGLRAVVHFTAYEGPSYSVSQIQGGGGYVSWEGEHTAVRGVVINETSSGLACGLNGVVVGDSSGAKGATMIVVFHPQWEPLRLLLQLPPIRAILPPGLPAHPQGSWTFRGHLSLDPAQTCISGEGYVLIADPMQ